VQADSVRTILYALGANLAIAAAKTAAELVGAINRAESAMRAEFPEMQWLFFEPDVAD